MQTPNEPQTGVGKGAVGPLGGNHHCSFVVMKRGSRREEVPVYQKCLDMDIQMRTPNVAEKFSQKERGFDEM